MNSRRRAFRKYLLVPLVLVVAAAIWLPFVHLFFKPCLEDYYVADGISPKARALARRNMALWLKREVRDKEIARMRSSNAEWDFMGRTYLVLSLANIALRDPAEKERCLHIIDQIIDETIRLEQENGIYYFLMDYARLGSFRAEPERSLFQDGEIALMLATRRMVEEKEAYKSLLEERVDFMLRTMKQSPVLSGESYPDECWMFCNAVALVAIRMAEVLDGTDHSSFIDEWLTTAKEKLVDAETGLLISCYAFSGLPYDGPEGSSIWMVAHCLEVVDPAFAKDQYLRAKEELASNFLGFGYAREWPKNWPGVMDVDSGPVIPVFDISAGSSGLAILGAAAFRDSDYLVSLLTSLNFGGFPVERDSCLKYCASNQVGDAVILYALVQGPLWEEVRARKGGSL